MYKRTDRMVSGLLKHSLRYLLASACGYLQVLLFLGLHAVSHRLPVVRVENPLKISWTNPQRISYKTGRDEAVDRRWIDAKKTKGGDWDRSVDEISTDKWYDALYTHFVHGVSWTEIEEVRTTIRRTKEGGVKWHGCRSERDVHDRCARLDTIFENIQKEGYKSQAELRWGTDPSTISLRNFIKFKEFYDEISVDVARDGSLLFVDGRHRLAIAQIAEVEQVPVRIVVRHEQWQSFRNALLSRTGSQTKHQFLHPDLQNIPYKYSSNRWYDAISKKLNSTVDTVIEINGGLSGYFCHRFHDEGLSTHSIYINEEQYAFHKEHVDMTPMSHTPHTLRQFSPESVDGPVAIVFTDPFEINARDNNLRRINELDIDSVFFNVCSSDELPVTIALLDVLSHSNEERLIALDENEGLYGLTCR